MSVGKLRRYTLPFANVVASGWATTNLNIGRTLETLNLKLGGTSLTKAMLSTIRIKANGKAIFEATGSQCDKLNQYRGEAADAAFLDIQFADRTGLTEADRMVGALDTTAGIMSLSAEIQIAGATAPTLVGITTESSPQGTNKNLIPASGVLSKVLRYPFSVATGGQLSIPLPFGGVNGAMIKRIHVEHTGNMTGATVKQDSFVVHESVKAENEYEQKRWGRVPQTNLYTLDFVLDGNFAKAMDTRDARTFEVLPTFSAADNGFVIVEYLDALGNL
ncbi:MAG: hypothetical protein EG825_10305 [Rhodocyclaceae bacterium]|nr:hypothetical protein [Rhodocyclaceae bacterium]